jgi:hypothetical protein
MNRLVLRWLLGSSTMALALLGMTGAHAASYACTIGGQTGVWQGGGAPGAGSEHTMTYQTPPDVGTSGLVLNTVPGPFPVSSTTVQISDSSSLVFGNTCGSPGGTVNALSMSGWFGQSRSDPTRPPQFSGQLVDTDNDRRVDALHLSLDVNWSHLPAVVACDYPLTFQEIEGVTYAVIPRSITVCGVTGVPTEGPWYIPVDATSRNMNLECPGSGIGPFVITDTAYAVSGGVCRGVAVPVAGGWGAALLALGLLATGVLTMRRLGAGSGLLGA